MKVDKINIRILMTTRQYLLYTVALGCLIMLLVGVLLIPQGQEAYDTFNKIQKEKPNTEVLTKKLASLDSITSTAEYAQIEVVDKALPSKKPVLELLTSLSTVSNNTGVVIQAFDLSPGLVSTQEAALLNKTESRSAPASNKAYESLRVNVEVAGTFQQVQDFIIQVERVSPFSTVTQMDLAGVLDEETAPDEEQLFKAVLMTETYYFTQPISVRIETPLPIIAAKEQSVLAALAAFAPINVLEQTEVRGGGLEDLFKSINEVSDQELLQDLINERNAEATQDSPSPAPAASTAPAPTAAPEQTTPAQ